MKGLLILLLAAPCGAESLVEYLAERAKEARVGHTVSFDGTNGGSAYLPIRWIKDTRLLESGIGYHHQEAGEKKLFLYAGTDMQSLYRATIKKWFNLEKKLDGPPLFPVYFSTWVNSYQGKPWVIGREMGVQSSVNLVRF